MNKNVRIKDGILNGITYLFSSIGVIVLAAILIFIFKNGFNKLSFDMIFGDYNQTVYNVKNSDFIENDVVFENPNIENSYFSSKWGISLSDGYDNGNEKVVFIDYVDSRSPFTYLVNSTNNELFKTEEGFAIRKLVSKDKDGNAYSSFPRRGAEEFILNLEKSDIITDMALETVGGGIRGSLITTFYLILLTLLIALPIGIIAAIYLAQYSKENKIKNIIKTMIDMISGIPSIIFGLVGVIIFVPMINKITNTNGGSILAGAFTLAIMLLPVIIRTTEEAINVIPKHYRSASLALGASETQTTFKVILPNALPGILTATLLSIGRIIGESAALIYVMGTSIMDNISISSSSTSLAVHIWSVMSGENPNIEQACAISIIILFTVLILSILVKLIGRKLNKYGER